VSANLYAHLDPHDDVLRVYSIDPTDQRHRVERVLGQATSRWRATRMLKETGYEPLGLWRVNTDYESIRKIQLSTTPALPAATTITNSRYDHYDQCPTCGQPAGSPCVSLHRIPSGRPVHPLTSVHPGRPLEQKD
jgi:hypothetical protein